MSPGNARDMLYLSAEGPDHMKRELGPFSYDSGRVNGPVDYMSERGDSVVRQWWERKLAVDLYLDPVMDLLIRLLVDYSSRSPIHDS